MKKFPVKSQAPNDAVNAALEYIHASLGKCRLNLKTETKPHSWLKNRY